MCDKKRNETINSTNFEQDIPLKSCINAGQVAH